MERAIISFFNPSLVRLAPRHQLGDFITELVFNPSLVRLARPGGPTCQDCGKAFSIPAWFDWRLLSFE